MSVDVFVSYSSKDAKIAKRLVKVLEANDYEVWWAGDDLVSGEFSLQIDESLKEAKCVLLLWTRNAAKSRWVAAEAETAAGRQVLIPVHMDGSEPPLGLRSLHWKTLEGWKGGARDPNMIAVLTSISTLLDREPPAEPDPPNFLVRWSVLAALVAAPLVTTGWIATSPPTVPVFIEADVSAISFRTASPGTLFASGAMLREFEASEILSVEGEGFPPRDVHSVGLYLQDFDDANAGVEVNSLPLGAGTDVSVTEQTPGVYAIDIHAAVAGGGTGAFELQTFGSMSLEMTDSVSTRTRVVESGDSVAIDPFPELLRATLYGFDFPIGANVVIDSLFLTDFSGQGLEEERLRSGVGSGTLELGGFDTHRLAMNERVTFGGIRGEILSVSVGEDGGIHFQFDGTISSFVTRSGDEAVDVIGGSLAAFVTYSRSRLVLLVFAWLLVTSLVGTWWWREPIHWWTRLRT